MIRLSMEITHVCNKYCPRCSHRVATSSFGHITMEEYELFREANTGIEVDELLMLGGEPLVHPQFREILHRVRADFPKTRLLMTTNGVLLPKLSPEDRAMFSRITVSYYGSWNRDLVLMLLEHPEEYPNVFFVDSTNMDDPNHDPNLGVDDARRAFDICNQKCYRFLGRHIYGCCLSESIERHYKTKCAHMDIQPGWLGKFDSLPTLNACQHCYFASMLLGNPKLRLSSKVYNILDTSFLSVPCRLVKRQLVRRKLKKAIELANSEV